jgi:hypothetical protein
MARYSFGDVFDERARGTTQDMRVGLIASFAVGYYLGSKAGRARYEQIHRWLEDARRTSPVERVQVAVERGVERLRERAQAASAETSDPDVRS